MNKVKYRYIYIYIYIGLVSSSQGVQADGSGEIHSRESQEFVRHLCNRVGVPSCPK